MPRHLYQAPALLGQLLMPLVQAAGGHIGPATRRQTQFTAPATSAVMSRMNKTATDHKRGELLGQVNDAIRHLEANLAASRRAMMRLCDANANAAAAPSEPSTPKSTADGGSADALAMPEEVDADARALVLVAIAYNERARLQYATGEMRLARSDLSKSLEFFARASPERLPDFARRSLSDAVRRRAEAHGHTLLGIVITHEAFIEVHS